MEDSKTAVNADYIAEDGIAGNGSALFAILDGHGGPEISEFCAREMAQVYLLR